MFKSDFTYHVIYFHVQPCVQLQLPRFKNINIQVSLYLFFFLAIEPASEFNFPTLLSFTSNSPYHMDSWELVTVPKRELNLWLNFSFIGFYCIQACIKQYLWYIYINAL